MVAPLTGKTSCKHNSKRSGKRCKNPPLTGTDGCWMHGRGSRKRVKEGKRKDPTTASITHGLTATQETLKRHSAMHPEYAVLVDSYLEDEAKLYNTKELLARVWAAVDILSQKSPHWITDPLTGQTFAPPIVPVLVKLCQVLESVARQEGRLKGDGITINNMISIKSTQEFTRVVLRVLDDFIPDPAVRADAVRKIEEGLRAMLPQEPIEVKAS